ncbi:hypothetical protein ADICYQ_3370 [Cyclobacterium qasimii M12-11B]|uniref:Uncharacterized protein n=1 Tax=Cyclobacterium qasimii M12-11B TaxID=641524 RepID=S7VDD9_9BACT|nr:hypothetical protein ADICYQ_3370 [Cyclobacterium qasimii M12-11B]
MHGQETNRVKLELISFTYFRYWVFYHSKTLPTICKLLLFLD